MSETKIKLCPLCESFLTIVQDDFNNGEPYLECPNCGLRFEVEGFDESPKEIKAK